MSDVNINRTSYRVADMPKYGIWSHFSTDFNTTQQIFINLMCAKIHDNSAKGLDTRIADLGCGWGLAGLSFIHQVVHEAGQIDLTLIDQSSQALEMAAENVRAMNYTNVNVSLQRVDLQTEIPDIEQVDIVILSNILHFLSQGSAYRLLHSLSQISAPNAAYYVSACTMYSRPRLGKRRSVSSLPKRSYREPVEETVEVNGHNVDMLFFTPECMLNFLSQADLSIVASEARKNSNTLFQNRLGRNFTENSFAAAVKV